MQRKASGETVFAESDFRVVFAQMDSCALIKPAEFATLFGITTNAFYQRDVRGEFPSPVMRKNRCVRWRAQDVRDWLQKLVPQEPAQREAAPTNRKEFDGPRRGRRRKTVERPF